MRACACASSEYITKCVYVRVHEVHAYVRVLASVRVHACVRVLACVRVHVQVSVFCQYC